MLIKFEPNTLMKAFFLNSFATSLLAVIAITIQKRINKYSTNGITEFIITFLGTMVSSVIVYFFLYFTFGIKNIKPEE